MVQRKLTMEVATSIRHLYKDLEYTQQQLANIFNIANSTVYNIIRNVTYGDAEYNPTYISDTPLLRYYNKNIKIHYLYHTLTYEQSFKPIDGFPHYKICVDGTVFSDIGFHYMPVKAQLYNNGYKFVRLYDENHKFVNKSIHTLLANHFLTNTHNLPCVLHCDDDKKNNILTNLYFGDYKDNVVDAKRNGRYIRVPDVTRMEIKKTMELIPNITNTELVRRFGIGVGAVRKIRKELAETNNN